MIAELAAAALIQPPANNQFETHIQPISITAPFETPMERQERIDAAFRELLNEKKTSKELEDKKSKVTDKIKAESDKIQQLKDQIAAKKEQERIAAEAAALAAEQARIAEEQQAVAVQQVAPQAKAAYRGNGGANAYGWGQCTWHVKNMRPDIGSYWGNANQWLGSAQAAGYSTGSQPVVGAIGVDFRGAYGHVVYVTGVSDGGATISLSEMNYGGGVGVENHRTDSAYNYTFIY